MPHTQRTPGAGQASGGSSEVTATDITVTQPAPRSHYDDPAGIRRRRQAALRLPPLACGCRDPFSAEHLTDRCGRTRERAA